LKNLSTNLSSTLDNAVNNQILSIVSNMKSDLFNIKSELYKLNSDILVTLNDNKKDYINDIKLKQSIYSDKDLDYVANWIMSNLD
jgi:hypothetical protein